MSDATAGGTATRPSTPTVDKYAVVAFAPGFIVEDLRKVRARCAPSSVPVRDAGVTLKGDFPPPGDLAAVRAAIEQATRGFPPFTVRTIEPRVFERSGQADVILPLEASRQLEELHGRLVDALLPVTGGASHASDQSGGFRPHITVVHGIPLDGVEQTVKAIIGWRVNYFWTIRDVDLVGLENGRAWCRLDQFHFGKPV